MKRLPRAREDEGWEGGYREKVEDAPEHATILSASSGRSLAKAAGSWSFGADGTMYLAGEGGTMKGAGTFARLTCTAGPAMN